MKYLVEALDTYEVLGKQDAVLGRIPKTGEQFEVTKERLDVLLGENAYNTPFVKVIKAIEFEKKDILEEHIEKQEKEKPIENPKKKTTKKTKKDK